VTFQHLATPKKKKREKNIHNWPATCGENVRSPQQLQNQSDNESQLLDYRLPMNIPNITDN
jgi:hypothetical protein